MTGVKEFAEKISSLLHQTSTVDGQELEHVFFVSGGFGSAGLEGEAASIASIDEAGAGGGGGVAIPLGAYYVENAQMKFHVNPIVAMWSAVPLACIGACVLRGWFKACGRGRKHRRSAHPHKSKGAK